MRWRIASMMLADAAGGPAMDAAMRWDVGRATSETRDVGGAGPTLASARARAGAIALGAAALSLVLLLPERALAISRGFELTTATLLYTGSGISLGNDQATYTS